MIATLFLVIYDRYLHCYMNDLKCINCKIKRFYKIILQCSSPASPWTGGNNYILCNIILMQKLMCYIFFTRENTSSLLSSMNTSTPIYSYIYLYIFFFCILCRSKILTWRKNIDLALVILWFVICQLSKMKLAQCHMAT